MELYPNDFRRAFLHQIGRLNLLRQLDAHANEQWQHANEAICSGCHVGHGHRLRAHVVSVLQGLNVTLIDSLCIEQQLSAWS
jgi:hypothetical protein